MDDPGMGMAGSAVQEQDQLGVRLQRSQALPQISQDPNHELHTVPCRLPPPQHDVTVSGELIQYGLRRVLRDVMLVEQQKHWQELLRFGTIGYERDHGAALPAFGEGTTLFPVQESLTISERLDLHAGTSATLPKADHRLVHVHVNSALRIPPLSLDEVRPFPRSPHLREPNVRVMLPEVFKSHHARPHTPISLIMPMYKSSICRESFYQRQSPQGKKTQEYIA